MNFLKPSPEASGVIRSVKRLISESNEDYVERALAEAIYQERVHDWSERRRLVRSGGHPCALRLIGKKCNGGLGSCRPPGCDHPSLWNFEGKATVYVFQPYGLSGDTLRDLIQYCDERGLTFDVDTHPGWHFPGRVLFVDLAPKNGIYWKLPLHETEDL